MKIAVVTIGARGDTEPPLALADRLVEAGHEVRVLMPEQMADAARRIGCTVVELPSDPDAYYHDPAANEALRRGRSDVFMKRVNQIDPLSRGLRIQIIGREVRRVERVICHQLLEDVVVNAAERHRVRLGFMHCYPVWPNGTYPRQDVPFSRLPAWLNRLSYRERQGERAMLPKINAHRERIGLPPTSVYPWLLFRRMAPPFFYWVPRELLPPPREFGDNHHFTGHWRCSPRLRAALGEQELPARLVEFLDRGAAPLFVTFGSLPLLDRGVVELFVRVARSLGRRVVFGRGGSVVDVPESDDVMAVDGVDHERFLPRCLAVVHHGGAGTTGAGVRAGIPALVIPVVFDQAFWGRRLTALGVGAALPFRKLSEPRLRGSLERVLAAETQARAGALAARLAALPDGATTAARLITELADRFPIPDARAVRAG